jgi:hypothetical protein
VGIDFPFVMSSAETAIAATPAPPSKVSLVIVTDLRGDVLLL